MDQLFWRGMLYKRRKIPEICKQDGCLFKLPVKWDLSFKNFIPDP